MKLFKVIALLLVISTAGYSQIQGEGEVYLSGDRIEAKFNGGGINNFSEFINREFDYSKVTKAGKMEATFNVDESGNVTKIRISQMLDVASASEFIRVLKKCPKWEPARRGGKPISIEIKYPMVFSEKTNEKKPIKITEVEEASTRSTAESNSEDNSIYTTAGLERKPDFPGGMGEFYSYIGKNFKTPDTYGKSGKVFVTFVIEKDGSVTDVKVIRDMGFGTGREAIRVLKNCPNWIPGEQKGKKVRVLYSLPISIQPRK